MRPLRSLLVLGLAVAALAIPRAAAAGKGKKYHFAVADVAASTTVPAPKQADVLAPIKAQVEKAVAAHPQMVTLDGAPDPAADAKKFKAWLTRKKIAGAYKVNVEITAFEEELEDKDAAVNQEKRLIVRLELRMFSETIPDRKMGFSGEGSATVKLDVGKKLRPKDRTYAIQQAVELAVDDALATSLKQLASPPKPPKK